MKFRSLFLYVSAFLLGLGLRWLQLGALPLNDQEADIALQALAIAQGKMPLLGNQAGYSLLTGIPFYFFESNNFLARLLPALAGSLILFAPAQLLQTSKSGLIFGRIRAERERIALIAVFLLAQAPGLVAVSRQAGGTGLALTGGLFAFAFWRQKRPQAAGICAGLALLGGPSLWLGLLIAALTWAIAQSLRAAPKPLPAENENDPAVVEKKSLKIAALYAAGTLLTVGTLFFLAPNGLNAFFASLVGFFENWRHPAGVSLAQFFSGLLFYYPLALLFGIIGSIRSLLRRSRTGIYLSLAALIALLVLIFYPARQVSDLVWAVLPLWFLAADELNLHLRRPLLFQKETFGVGIFTALMLAFAWLVLINRQIPLFRMLPNINTRPLLLLGIFTLLLLILMLVSMDLSPSTAVRGSLWGAAFMLGLYTFSIAWGASGLRTPNGSELWDNEPRLPQAGLLLESIDSISNLSQNARNKRTIGIYEVDSPALLWLLRRYNLRTLAALPPEADSPPDWIITPLNAENKLKAGYRGQDFRWRQKALWQYTGLDRWFALREVPVEAETIILWGRNDLFFDAQPTLSEENPDL